MGSMGVAYLETICVLRSAAKVLLFATFVRIAIDWPRENVLFLGS